MKIVLTGGGTAGHVVPHIALLDDLKKNFNEIVYVGSKSGMEKDLIEKQKNIKYYSVETTKFVRKKFWKNLLIPFKLCKGIHQSKKILKEEKPNVIFSKGGFVSLPVVIASKSLKIPVVAHESDLEMGLANRISKPYCKVICTSFEKTAQKCKKAICTGSPIRKDMIKDKQTAMSLLKIETKKPILVVTGGSLGSRFLNQKIWSEIHELTDKFFVIHLTGKNNFNEKLKNLKDYVQIEFSLDIGTILSCADIVVSRAGSNTIFELAVMKKPMLLVPLPKGNSRGDQVDNAKYFNEQGLANFVTEEQLESEAILKHITQTFNEKEELVKNINNHNITVGNKKIIEILCKTAKENQSLIDSKKQKSPAKNRTQSQNK